MKISLVVAVSDNDVIAKDGRTPWFVRGEMLIFKRVTLGAPVIMGRKTYEHPKAYKARPRLLPGRLNVVLTHNSDYQIEEGGVIAHSLEEALALKEVKNAPEAFIIGGKQLFDEALPRAQRIYLTRVHLMINGGTTFSFDPDDWRMISSKTYPPNEVPDRPYGFDFQVWERIK